MTWVCGLIMVSAFFDRADTTTGGAVCYLQPGYNVWWAALWLSIWFISGIVGVCTVASRIDSIGATKTADVVPCE